MKTIDLQMFCSTDETRPRLHQPWVQRWGRSGDGPLWSWASCGRLLVGVPGEVSGARLDYGPIGPAVWADLEAGATAREFLPLPALPPPVLLPDEDDGPPGVLYPVAQRVEILGRDYSDILLRLVRDYLPGAEIAALAPDARADGTPLVGRGAGGAGWCLMPIRRFGRDGQPLS